MNTVTQGQILDKTVYIHVGKNSVGKGMNPTILS